MISPTVQKLEMIKTMILTSFSNLYFYQSGVVHHNYHFLVESYTQILNQYQLKKEG